MPTIRERVRALSSADRLRYETVAEQFDQAWSTCPDKPPDISAYVPPDEPVRTLLLVALVTSDMEQRCGRGEPWRVEHYLARHPELNSDDTALVELVCWEYGLTDAEERRPDDYYRRFPSIADTLRQTLDRTSPARPWVAPSGYTDVQEIGRGGMGVVYVARHVKLERKVALKVLSPGLALDDKALARFELEAKLVANLDHPNIVKLYDVGVHEGLPFYAMEYCPGGSLKDRLRGSVLDAREAARVTETLARGAGSS
jgi:serine/threonine-protein kinase